MGGHSWVCRLVAGLALASVVGGCAVSATSAPPGTPIPTVSSAPSASVSPSGSEQWGYVPFGDSIMVTVSPHYELMVQASNGVPLTIPVGSMRPGAPSDDILSAIRTDAALRDAVSNARLIVIQVPVGEFATCSDTFEAVPASQAEIDACLDPVVSRYEANVDAFFAEIMGLRSPSAAVRAMDVYEEAYGFNVQKGIHDWLKPYWQRISAAVIAAGGRFGVPVARVYHYFMGASGDDDPVASGMVQGDLFHPSWDGAEEIATLLNDLGYEPTPVQP
jgi:hypothetical protein